MGFYKPEGYFQRILDLQENRAACDKHVGSREMDYQPLFLHCQCGETPARIDEVGFSAAHELVIHWWCASCNHLVHTAMPLADCWQVCPKPPVEQTPVEVPYSTPSRFDDESFLRSLGVRFPGADEG